MSERGSGMLAERPFARHHHRLAEQSEIPAMRRLALLIGAAWAAGGAAAAQDVPGDPAGGAVLAREVCATCHVVADDQMVDPGIGPSLLEVAEQPATTEMSLRAFFQTPHPTMPNLILSPEETDDIIAYLITLKGE
jgi:mono/diheme cytochrome c family protein